MKEIIKVWAHEAAEFITIYKIDAGYKVEFDGEFKEFKTLRDAKKDTEAYLCDCGSCDGNYYLAKLKKIKEKAA